MDILIKNGTIIDGTGEPSHKADISVLKGKIDGIGAFASMQATEVIDAEGMYVAPGFIDILNHSDSYLTILKTPSSESLLRQGITTALLGNCGSSLAPLIHAELITGMQKWADIGGININWERFDEFLNVLSTFKLGVNVGSLVGHATLRRGFLDHSMDEANDEQIKKMQRLLTDALNEGAFGLSFAPAYLHGRPAGNKELLPLVSMVAEKKGLFSVHLRDEGERILESLNEIINLVKETGVRTEIGHFKVSGSTAWHLADQALTLIDNAVKENLPIHFDIYPYLRSSLILYLLFPHWAQEGGRRAMMNRLKDISERNKIVKEIESGPYRDILGRITIGTAHRDKTFVGKSVENIAKNQDVSFGEVLCNLMAANEGRVHVFVPDISLNNLRASFQHKASFVATSGAGYDMSLQKTTELPHPRSFGSFVRALAIGNRKWNMPLETIVHKMTAGPAEHIGLTDRGKIVSGLAADIVIFDLKKLKSRSHFSDPFRYPSGINYVLVNGKIAVNPEGLSGVFSGKVLRRD
ncbi:MAG: Amidohydrolase 3 [Parcubacteria group bacterium GW2011_GWA2_40_8]|nr:MAG: Amidohydrolase 3 [Parcubacteria group bacterium GW2011_GWA2_40_8]